MRCPSLHAILFHYALTLPITYITLHSFNTVRQSPGHAMYTFNFHFHVAPIHSYNDLYIITLLFSHSSTKPGTCVPNSSFPCRFTFQTWTIFTVHCVMLNWCLFSTRITTQYSINKIVLFLQFDKAWDMRSKLVISMSLYGSNMDYIYGALRYAQLVPILYPNWRRTFNNKKR